VRVRQSAPTPDKEPPKLKVLKPSPEATFTVVGRKVVLNGTASDNTEVLEVRWIGSPVASGKAGGTDTWKVEVPLKPGENTVTIVATDKYLNSSSKKLTIFGTEFK